jgi:hypothetical protein
MRKGGVGAASEAGDVADLGHAAEQETDGVGGETGVQGDEVRAEGFGIVLQEVKDGLAFRGEMGILRFGVRMVFFQLLKERLAGVGGEEAQSEG